MKVGLVQETAEHRSIFAESWTCRAFLFASAAVMEHSPSNAVRSSSLGGGGLRAPKSIIACVDLLDVFSLQSGVLRSIVLRALLVTIASTRRFFETLHTK